MKGRQADRLSSRYLVRTSKLVGKARPTKLSSHRSMIARGRIAHFMLSKEAAVTVCSCAVCVLSLRARLRARTMYLALLCEKRLASKVKQHKPEPWGPEGRSAKRTCTASD